VIREQPVPGVDYPVIETPKMGWRMTDRDPTPSLGSPIGNRSPKVRRLKKKSPTLVTYEHPVSLIGLRKR
jgi:hypothetical protein